MDTQTTPNNELLAELGTGLGTAATTGQISGFKWNDLDGDGVREADEPGLAGWTIYLDNNQNGVFDDDEVSALTDANGQYVFPGLEPGDYIVGEVQQPGWTQSFPGNTPVKIGEGFLGGSLSSSISGNHVVWQSGGFGTDSEIYLYDGETTRQLTDNNTPESYPQISGDNVVWSSGFGTGSEIYLYDGETTRQLTDNNTLDYSPKISGDNVVWSSGVGTGSEIYLYDGETTRQLTNNNTSEYSTQISGDNVVWSNGGFGTGSEIYLYDGETTRQLTNNNIFEYSTQISGDNVVWQSGGFDTGWEIYLLGADKTHSVTLEPSEQVTDINFGNQQQSALKTGEIRGRQWNDANGDGSQSAGETGLSGWTVYLDANANGQLDAGETSTVTDTLGSYAFEDLQPGTYTVVGLLKPGWQQTYPGEDAIDTLGDYTVTVSAGEVATGINFGNRQAAIDGTPFGDSLVGSILTDTLNGLDGNDRLYGLDGDDSISGGKDDDLIVGDRGNDRLKGDAGHDFIYGNQGQDTIEGGLGDDYVTGNKDDDRVSGNENNDSVYGGFGNDWLFGNSGNDLVVGGYDDDRVEGNRGDDTLIGIAPLAILFPGMGELDALKGNEDRDVFVLGDTMNAYYQDGSAASAGLNDYAAIVDFNPTEDVIQLYGKADNYQLAAAPDRATDTGIFLKSEGANELIGVVRNAQPSQLNLASNSFVFVF
jgi:beta propeller repeat protein